MSTEKYSKAYKEILLFMKALPKEYRDAIPYEVYKVFKDNQDNGYHPDWEGKIEKTTSGEDLALLPETLTLVAWLNLEFWEDSEEKRRELYNIYDENGQWEKIEEAIAAVEEASLEDDEEDIEE
ncbi:MAG: hypothetical protein E7228_06405 [Clostridiales bacterium]|nr:hypothetical protein [Clostridiales bacterium]